jgi:hypothetical protein
MRGPLAAVSAGAEARMRVAVFHLVVGLLAVAGSGLAWAGAPASEQVDRSPGRGTPPVAGVAAVGFVDADRDGLNDRFRDADGDGVCDVTGRAYLRRFAVVDADGDGLNDVFIDGDGNGVNDLDDTWADADGDRVCDNVLDADGDGRNDITGEAYGDGAGGWGLWRAKQRAARDVAGDQQDGDRAQGVSAEPETAAGMDVFVDSDGDGIADGRTVRGRQGAVDYSGRFRGSPAGSGSAWVADGQGQGAQGRDRGRRGQGTKD